MTYQPTDDELMDIGAKARDAAVRNPYDARLALGRAAYDAVLALLAKPREGDERLSQVIIGRFEPVRSWGDCSGDTDRERLQRAAEIIALVRQHDVGRPPWNCDDCEQCSVRRSLVEALKLPSKATASAETAQPQQPATALFADRASVVAEMREAWRSHRDGRSPRWEMWSAALAVAERHFEARLRAVEAKRDKLAAESKRKDERIEILTAQRDAAWVNRDEARAEAERTERVRRMTVDRVQDEALRGIAKVEAERDRARAWAAAWKRAAAMYRSAWKQTASSMVSAIDLLHVPRAMSPEMQRHFDRLLRKFWGERRRHPWTCGNGDPSCPHCARATTADHDPEACVLCGFDQPLGDDS